jgi:hypothetical protein
MESHVSAERHGLKSAEGFARCAALTSCMPWVNLGLIFAVLYPVAATSVVAWSAARDRPAEALRFQ